MSDIICITNRKLCTDDFITRMQTIIAAKPHAVILREKDLPDAQYALLAQQLLPICKAHDVPLILNGHTVLAQEMDCMAHLPFARKAELRSGGISIHSPVEAGMLQTTTAAYCIAGHIWDTACKAGLSGRGTAFLQEVVENAGQIPVYAIGGVTPERMPQVYAAGAKGACVMSALMQCDDPAAYLHAFIQSK